MSNKVCFFFILQKTTEKTYILYSPILPSIYRNDSICQIVYLSMIDTVQVLQRFLLEKYAKQNGKNPLKTLKSSGQKKQKPSTGSKLQPKCWMTRTRRSSNGSPMENSTSATTQSIATLKPHAKTSLPTFGKARWVK